MMGGKATKKQKDYGYIKCQRCGEKCRRTNAPQKYCAPCQPIAKRKATRSWEIRNIDDERIKRLCRSKRWRAANRAKHRASTNAASIRWQKRNPEKVRKTRKRASDKRRSTYRGRLNHNLAVALRQSLQGNKNRKTWSEFVSFTLDDLIRHLERQFSAGMSWANHGRVWHIDHIIPLASFAYESHSDDAFKAAWALTNLRPLWKIENLKKSATRTLLI